MNNSVLDPRLVGLTAGRVTKKFVQNNLTPAELDEPYFKDVYKTQEKRFDVRGTTTETVINELNAVKDYITKLSGTSDKKFDGIRFMYNTAAIRYLVLSKEPIDAVSYYVTKWKKEINAHKKEQDEYKQYLELKKRFGE